MSDPAELAGFSGTVPIFPLPNVILFPQTVLPLHIFEPRYREMMDRALAGERLIAMALLRPGWEPEYYGNPPVFDVIGVGRILKEQKLDDGRYHLLLHGLRRARIVEVVSDRPYRTARVELLEDQLDPVQETELERKRLRLLAVYMTLAEKILGRAGERPDPETPLGTMCDVVAALLEVPIEKKQGVLEELDIPARVDRVLGMLKEGLAHTTAGRRWPPEPSEN